MTASIALWSAVQDHRGPQYVELGEQAAFLPKASVSRIMLSVPYSAIRQVRTVLIPGQQMILIDSSVGQARLLSKAFASSHDFALFLRSLQERSVTPPGTA